jgi:hypothetical protein
LGSNSILGLIDTIDLTEQTPIEDKLFWLGKSIKSIFNAKCVKALLIESSYSSEGFVSEGVVTEVNYNFKINMVISETETDYYYVKFDAYFDKSCLDFSFTLQDKDTLIVDFFTRNDLDKISDFNKWHNTDWYSYNAILYYVYSHIKGKNLHTSSVTIAHWEDWLLKNGYGDRAVKAIKVLKSMLSGNDDPLITKLLTKKF